MNRLIPAALLSICLAAPAAARDAGQDPELPFVALSADASIPAANDLASASAYVELTGADPAELARQANAVIAKALDTAKAYPQVRAHSAGTQTWPIYGKSKSLFGSDGIEGWRLRSTLALESGDLPALSALVGKLQTTLAVANLDLAPSPETRRKAEDEALVAALKNFEARAELATRTLGRKHRILDLRIDTGSQFQPQPMVRAAAMRSDAAPAPIEAGHTQISVQVSGRVELID